MHQRSSGVRGLVFGGIMAGLVLVCALIPPLGLFMPIPLVLAYVRYGGRVAALTGVVSGLLAVMFKGPVNAFLLTVPGGILPGLAFGYGFRHRLRPLMIGVIAVLVFVVSYASEYAVMRVALFDGRDPVVVAAESDKAKQMINQYFEAMDQVMALTVPRTEAERAAKEQQVALFAEMRRDPVGLVWALLPASLVLMGAITAWWNYLLCRWILPRFGHEVPAPLPFSQFRLPTWVVWVFALGSFGTAYLGKTLLNAPWWVKLAVNVMTPLQLVFMLAGMAVAYGYLRLKMNVTKPAAVALTVVLLLLPGVGIQLYMILAMWDTIFDFRGLGHGLWKRPEEAS